MSIEPALGKKPGKKTREKSGDRSEDGTSQLSRQCIPVIASLFEDTLDGYFPLRESIRQMMHRLGYGSALISMTQAPFLDLENVAADEPVPLRVDSQTRAGLVSRMILEATTAADNSIRLRGVGTWSWWSHQTGPDDTFKACYRLAEPAFVRGIGVLAGDFTSRTFGKLAIANPGSEFSLITHTLTTKPAWQTPLNTTRIWALQHRDPGIVRLGNNNLCWAESLQSMDELNRINKIYDYIAIDPDSEQTHKSVDLLTSDF